jgi:hypothetical protein
MHINLSGTKVIKIVDKTMARLRAGMPYPRGIQRFLNPMIAIPLPEYGNDL